MIELGRYLFVFCLWYSWCTSALLTVMSDRLPYTRGVRWREILAALVRARVVIALSVGFAVASVAFARGYRQALAGVILLFLMAALRRLEVRQWPGNIVVGLGKYVPTAAALGGYLLGWILTADRPLPEREAWGWEGACGVMAGAYLLAGIAKLRESGSSWISGVNIALLVAERSFTGPRPVQALRRWAVGQPWLCRFSGVYGLVIELAVVVFIVPELRWAVTVAIVLLQVAILVLLGYWELEWIVLTVALTLASSAG